jgi:hypothetical protein
MIYPTHEQLLAGIAEALKETVLPELARGTAARKQLQAAIEILRRIAFALPGEAAALAANNDDMAEVIGRIEAMLSEHSPPPNLPPQGGGTRSEALPLNGGGLGGGDASARNKALQTRLIDLQDVLTDEAKARITPLLTGLYQRMTDRALALIPPPLPRTPRKPS